MKKIILVAFLLVLASCANNSGLTDAQQYIWDNKISGKKATDIMQGTITMGMSQADVRAARGAPCSYCYGTTKNSWGDTWEYNTFGTGVYGIGRGTYIFFDNKGKVTGWSK